MKLLFDKLKTSDGIVRVSFDDEVTWNEYNVADVKDTGITFTEDDCPDLTKIRIAGAITKISDIKTHIINESISQDLTTDEQIENLRLQINSFSNSTSNEEINILKNRFENFLWNYNATNNKNTLLTGSWNFNNSMEARDLFGEVITPSITPLYLYTYEYTISIPLNKLNNIKLWINDNYIYPKDIISDTLPDKSILNARINSLADIEKFSDLYDIPEYNMTEKAQQPWYWWVTNSGTSSFKMGTIYKVLDYIECSKDPIHYDYPPTLKLTPIDIVYILTGIDYTSVNDMPSDHKSIYDYFDYLYVGEGRDYFEFSFLTNGLLLKLLDEIDDGSTELVLNEALISSMITQINTYEIPIGTDSVWNTINNPSYGDIQYWDNNIGIPEILYNKGHNPAMGTNYLKGFTTFLLRKFLSQQTAYSFKEWLWWDLHPSYQTMYYPTIFDIANPLEGIVDTNKLYMTKNENNLTITYYGDNYSSHGISYQKLKY